MRIENHENTGLVKVQERYRETQQRALPTHRRHNHLYAEEETCVLLPSRKVISTEIRISNRQHCLSKSVLRQTHYRVKIRRSKMYPNVIRNNDIHRSLARSSSLSRTSTTQRVVSLSRHLSLATYLVKVSITSLVWARKKS